MTTRVMLWEILLPRNMIIPAPHCFVWPLQNIQVPLVDTLKVIGII